MERKDNEKPKSNKHLTIFNLSSTNKKNDRNENNEDEKLKPKSGKLGHLIEYDFEEKLKKLFDSQKFTIGNQFDQEGSDKFLNEKDECLKLMDLDYTVLYSTKKDSKKDGRKLKNKNKDRKSNLNHDEKYISDIKIVNENVESFLSSESSINNFKEFISNLNEEK